jgi:hypothetical protein
MLKIHVRYYSNRPLSAPPPLVRTCCGGNSTPNVVAESVEIAKKMAEHMRATVCESCLSRPPG